MANTSAKENYKKKQNYKNIIKINILQTPSKLGVLQSKTFSHTPDEAMLG